MPRRDFGRTGFSSFLSQLAIMLALVVAQPCEAKPPGELQGKLGFVPGSGPVLKTLKKDYSLSARTSYLLNTLGDKRLLNREVRLEGTFRPDGTFQVDKFFTVRDGKLYRVRYYCEVCNIEALEPGECVCCRQPTELQEISVSEPDKEAIVTR